MSYVRDHLLPNEKVLFEARIHPAVYLSAVIFGIAMVLFFIMALGTTRVQDGSASLLAPFELCLSAFFFLVAVVSAVQAFILILTTEFAVTNRRVIAKSGFVRRRTMEMLLSKVESVSVRQNILARLLDFGTVTVCGTGGTREGFRAIRSPMEVRTRINQTIEDYTRAADQPQRVASASGEAA